MLSPPRHSLNMPQRRQPPGTSDSRGGQFATTAKPEDPPVADLAGDGSAPTAVPRREWTVIERVQWLDDPMGMCEQQAALASETRQKATSLDATPDHQVAAEREARFLDEVAATTYTHQRKQYDNSEKAVEHIGTEVQGIYDFDYENGPTSEVQSHLSAMTDELAALDRMLGSVQGADYWGMASELEGLGHDVNGVYMDVFGTFEADPRTQLDELQIEGTVTDTKAAVGAVVSAAAGSDKASVRAAGERLAHAHAQLSSSVKDVADSARHLMASLQRISNGQPV